MVDYQTGGHAVSHQIPKGGDQMSFRILAERWHKDRGNRSAKAAPARISSSMKGAAG